MEIRGHTHYIKPSGIKSIEKKQNGAGEESKEKSKTTAMDSQESASFLRRFRGPNKTIIQRENKKK